MIPDRPSLAVQATSSFAWNLAGGVTRSAVALVLNAVLARTLGPEPFGIVAVAMAVIGLGNLAIESGLTVALIRETELDRNRIGFVFTLQAVLGVLLAAVVILLAPAIGVVIADPQAIPVLRALAVTLVLQALAQVPSALLRRTLSFKDLQTIQILSYVLAFSGVALPLAFLGYGVWSLVMGQVGQNLLTLWLLYRRVRIKPRLALAFFPDLVRFGGVVQATNILNWTIGNLDTLVIGHMGSSQLGIYNRAQYLINTPLVTIVAASQAVLFSSLSRRQRDMPVIREAFAALFALVALVSLPAASFLVVFAEDVVRAFYGDRWSEASSVLLPLALSSPLFALMAIQGPILNAVGRPGAELRAQCLTALVAVGLLPVASTMSLVAVAWAVFLICLFRLFLITMSTARVLGLPVLHASRPLAPALTLACISWGSASVMNNLTRAAPLALSLSVSSLGVFLLWLGVVWLGRRWIIPAWLWRQIAPTLRALGRQL